MIATQGSLSGCAELERAVRHQIVQHAGGRVRALEVEVIDDRVIVRGRAGSFYVKQLALQGILDVLGSAGPMRIELDVRVEARPPRLDARVPSRPWEGRA